MQLGGLGPNKDEKWEKAMQNLQKRKSFGAAVRHKNEENPSDKLFKLVRHNKSNLNDINNSRFRAMEFAKTIRR